MFSYENIIDLYVFLCILSFGLCLWVPGVLFSSLGLQNFTSLYRSQLFIAYGLNAICWPLELLYSQRVTQRAVNGASGCHR